MSRYKDVPLSTATHAFLQSLRASGFSHNTVANAASCYLLFQNRVGDISVSQAATHAVDFLAWRARTVKRNSLCANFAHMKGLCAYCVREGYIKKSPLEGMRYPRQEKVVTQPLSDQAMLRIVEYALGWQRSAVLLLFGTGMRIGELANLTWDDVGDGVLLLHGKGSKQRTVAPGAVALRELMRLPRKGRKVFPVSGNAIKDGFRRLSKRSGVPFHPHQIRHTFAHKFLTHGGAIEDLSQILGHSCLDTTAIYIRAFRRERALDAQRHFNPTDSLFSERSEDSVESGTVNECA